MSAITPNYRTVQQLLQSQSFSIDEYQREYKWDKQNIEELLADLQEQFFNSYKLGDSTEQVKQYGEYFLGSIIVTDRDGKNYLVDGQQRVTSLTLLLICLYRLASKKGLAVRQTVAPLIFSDNLGKPEFNLNIPERLPLINALFKGQEFNLDGEMESVRNMLERYRDIEENDLLDQLDVALPHFIYWLLTRVGLIEIRTSSDSNAYEIFETMNDRGRPLSPVDMLKAYLLAPISEPDARKEANEVWKGQIFDLVVWGKTQEPENATNCIKAWFRSQYAESIRERKASSTDKDWELIGSVFHRWARNKSGRLKLGLSASNLGFMCNSFPFFAKAYRRILAASREFTSGLESIFYNAHNNFTWQSTVLLAPLIETDDDETVRRKLAVTATYLDIWLMRRVVNHIRVGYSNTSYTMFLLCRDIRQTPLDNLINILSQRLADDDVTFAGSESRGRQGIDALVLNQSSRRYIFHLLARLTAEVEQGAGRNETFDKIVDRTVKNPYDLEHILADDYSVVADVFDTDQEFQVWRNHVASLLLLPADVNRSLQAKPFSQKSAIYARQNFYSASLHPAAYEHQPQFRKYISENDLHFEPFADFTKAEQQSRRRLIVKLVDIVWSPTRLHEVAR